MKWRKRFVAGGLAVIMAVVGVPYPGGCAEAEGVQKNEATDMDETADMNGDVDQNESENETVEDDSQKDKKDVLDILEEEGQESVDGTVDESVVEGIEDEEMDENEEDEYENAIDYGTIEEEYGQIRWIIDSEGRLTVTGTGDVAELSLNRNENPEAIPWYINSEEIVSAEINVTGMKDASGLFVECSHMVSIDLSRFDTSQVTDMSRMFAGCSSLEKMDLSGFDTSHVTNMREMFIDCSRLIELDLSGFNTCCVTNMDEMFYYCSNLSYLDVSNFTIGEETETDAMLGGCSSLVKIKIPSNVTQSISLPNAGGTWYAEDGDIIHDFPQYLDYKMTLVKKLDTEPEYVPVEAVVLSESQIVVKKGETARLAVSVIPPYASYGGVIDWSWKVSSSNQPIVDLGDDTVIGVSAGRCTITAAIGEKSATCDVIVTADGKIDEDYGQFEWSIDSEGKLTVTGTGDVMQSGDPDTIPWRNDTNGILSAQIDVTGMTNAFKLFSGCSNMASLDVSGLDTSQITNTKQMFADCEKLMELDIRNFDTGQVTDMSEMFSDCRSLTKLDLDNNKFKTGHVTDMSGMFDGCISLKNLDVSKFDTRCVTNMKQMFEGCGDLTVLDVSGFNTENVTDMSWMFCNCNGLTLLDVRNFDTRNVTDMMRMFWDCGKITELNVSSFDTGKVEDMDGMFGCCCSITELDVSNFDTSLVTSMWEMFRCCENLTELNLSNFNTSQVTYTAEMFFDCTNLKKIDISSFDTKNVTDIYGMFGGCENLTELDLRNFDTGNVERMQFMFEDCSSLAELDLSNFETGKVRDMGILFWGCTKLEKLNLSNFTISNSAETEGMFGGCNNLFHIKTPRDVKQVIALPTAFKTDIWYQEDGTAITSLPQNLGYSIIVEKNKIPEISYPYIRAQKTKTSFQCGEELTLDDLTVLYYESAENTKSVTEFKTNVSELDMSVPGTKTLLITYEGLRTAIEITVTAKDAEVPDEKTYTIFFDLQGHGVMLPEYADYKEIKEGSKIRKPVDPIESGYQFTGWYKEADCTNQWDFDIDTVTGDLTLYAGWMKNKEPQELGDVLPDDVPTDGEIPEGQIWTAPIKDITYTGKAIKPEVHIYWGKERLDEGIDYTLKYRNNTKANDGSEPNKAPQITVKYKKHFSEKQQETIYFRILPVNLDDVTADDLTLALSKKAQKKVPTATWLGKKLVKGKDFDVSYPDEGKAGAYQEKGEYAVLLTAGKSGNFTGSKTVNLTITDMIPVSKVSVKVKNQPYDKGNPVQPEPKVTYRGKALEKDVDYTVSYQNNTEIGTASAVITGAGKYQGTKRVNFKITGTSIKRAAVSGLTEKEYTGAAQIPEGLTVALGGNSLKEGTDYSVSYTKNRNAGKATVIISGMGQYTGTVKKTFKIKAYDLKLDESKNENRLLKGLEDDISVSLSEYTKGICKPEPVLTFKGRVLRKGRDYTLSYKNNKKAATAADQKAPMIVIKGKGNFKGTVQKAFTITE